MKKLLMLMSLLAGAVPASAQHDASAAAWRTIASEDAAAALRLIADNHPGAAPELGDRDFEQRLAMARRHVAERLPGATSFGGYNALMNGLAADFRDGHIWSAPIANWAVRTWAGILPQRRGAGWFVGSHDVSAGEQDLTGAEIVACDGRPFDALAKERIGLFAGNPDIEAELVKRAPTILLDDANPYWEVPRSCSFRQDGAPQTMKLSWRRIAQTQLQAAAAKTIRQPRAGMGVAAFPGGYWIALETLDPSAQAVVDAVRQKAEALRSAPMVVVDLRGNGGGNSDHATRIAEILAGPARMAAVETRATECSGAFWRATAPNLKTIEAARDAAQERGQPETAAYYAELATDMTAAIARGRGFAPDLPACARDAAALDQGRKVALPAAAMKGRLVLVTDFQCFSSCLVATNLFRRLGALHVGQATDMSTRYMEVREVPLPSGLRTFSTLQKVAVGLSDFGPYRPERAYPGALDDTDAVKAWVAGLR